MIGHIHDVAAGVALLALWEAAKSRGAIAMRWDGRQWVVSIAGEWVVLAGGDYDIQAPHATQGVRVET